MSKGLSGFIVLLGVALVLPTPVLAQEASELAPVHPDSAAAASQDSTQEAEEKEKFPRFSLIGDLRPRLEIDRRRPDASNRTRGRVRFRLEGRGELGAGITVGARIVTREDEAVDNPKSPYWDFGKILEKAGIALDRIYARWNPEITMPVEVWAGKYQNPFTMPAIYGELLWDEDLMPEGGAVIVEPLEGLRVAGGAFALLTQNSGRDVGYGQAQVSGQVEPIRDLRFDAAVGGYWFGNTRKPGIEKLTRRNEGNALLIDAQGDTLGYASNFNIWQGAADVVYKGLPIPITVAGEYFVNASAAPGFDDDGFGLGARIGSLGQAGRWRVEYRYQDVGQESAFSVVTQDDFLRTVNFRGHLAGAAWQYLSFSRIRAWMLWSARNEPRSETFQRRFRLDLDFLWRIP